MLFNLLFYKRIVSFSQLQKEASSMATKAWKTECAELIDKRKILNQRYISLKDEVKEAEQIRKNVYSILRQEQREQQTHRAKAIRVSRQTVSSIETGKYNPSLMLAFTISVFFEMAIEEIFINERRVIK